MAGFQGEQRAWVAGGDEGGEFGGMDGGEAEGEEGCGEAHFGGWFVIPERMRRGVIK